MNITYLILYWKLYKIVENVKRKIIIRKSIVNLYNNQFKLKKYENLKHTITK